MDKLSDTIYIVLDIQTDILDVAYTDGQKDIVKELFLLIKKFPLTTFTLIFFP